MAGVDADGVIGAGELAVFRNALGGVEAVRKVAFDQVGLRRGVAIADGDIKDVGWKFLRAGNGQGWAAFERVRGVVVVVEREGRGENGVIVG